MDRLSFIRNSNVRNFAKLLSANIVAQVIGLIVYPILTRMYAPEDFGLMNLFLSISGILVILSTAEYYNAIVLPKKDTEGVWIAYLCTGILLLIVGATGISVFFSDEIAQVFNTPALANYYWLLPISILISGSWNILNYWYIRHTQYSSISKYQLSQSTFSAVAKIGFGYAGILQGGLIYSMIIAPLLSLIIRLAELYKSGMKSQLMRPSWQEVKSMAQRYKKFPLFSLPRSFVNMVAGQLPVLLLTPLFGAEYIGWWSMALLLGFTPINMITRSIYQVLYQHTTVRVNSNQPIGRYFRRFTLWVVVVGIPLFGALYWLLPELTLWFLGEGWEMTSVYLRWMLPWLLCSILTASTGFLADIFFKQQIGFAFEILTAILRTAAVVIGIWREDFTLAIICYAIGTAISILAQYIWLFSLIKRYDAEVICASHDPVGDSET